MGFLVFGLVVLAVLVYELACLLKPSNTEVHMSLRHPLASFHRMGRKGKVATLTSVLVFALAGSALAYYLISAQGSTTGTTTLGGAPTPVNVTLSSTLPTGLTPGQSGTVALDVRSTATSAATINKITAGSISVDSTHAAAGCQAGWFTYTPPTGNGSLGVNVPIGSGPGADSIASANGYSDTQISNAGTLAFTQLASTDQSACEGATLSLPLSVS